MRKMVMITDRCQYKYHTAEKKGRTGVQKKQ